MSQTETVIFRARAVVSGRDEEPPVEAVAVRDGRILAIGSMADCEAWGPAEMDDRWREAVIVPGFVEAHAHVGEGALGTKVPYVGWFDRPLADGSTGHAIRSYADLVQRLQVLDAELTSKGEPDTVPLSAGGFDPIYFAGERRLDRWHLDAVGTRRPIYIQHANGHLATVSSAGLEHWGITSDLAVEGIGRDSDGQPNGELREGAQALARNVAARTVGSAADSGVIHAWAAAARRAGITTCTDLASNVGLAKGSIELWRQATSDPSFPIRAASFQMVQMARGSIEEIVDNVLQLRTEQHDRWRFPGVKIILDGSIQGWTAALSWPGYFTGEGHPMLLLPVERMRDLLNGFHRARVNVHVHCNGDLAAEAVLDAIEGALRESAWLDHRHTLTHAQTITAAQIRRAARLGVGLNFFTNHLWYWGDQHYQQTLGPTRAERLNPCADAAAAGVRFALHSDAPVTPLGQLHTMWCAVNRLTPSGRVLGNAQRISPARALRAVTLDAGWLLHLDHEIGSLEVGKRADFTILDDDPCVVDPMRIRDISVVGTMLGGVV